MPADVRPARPARWFAEASEQGVVVRTSIHVLGLYVLILTKPESTTYFIPSMVTLASAMLVEKITFRVSRGEGSKISDCSSGGRVA